MSLSSLLVRRAGLVAALVALGAAGPVAEVASAAHHRRHHERRHHHRHHAGGIPQHNGGDHDGDNNGGPTDGDGNR